ncbi:MAG TPA: hypothetical protein VLG67_00220 [Candidatus Saccharimonadales bacterium]|nr:hypothetical protein [Candidatus Saccharimonadales bacterium]
MKFPNRPIDGAAEGLQLLRDQDDVAFGGIATGRRKVLRPWTPRQAKKVGVKKEEITYTENSKDFAPKIIDVLNAASDQELRAVSKEVTRVFFIDDNVKGMRESAEKLAQDQHYRDVMDSFNFTFVAFNPRPDDNLEDLIVDGRTVMRIVPMKDWQPETVERVLQELRQTPETMST